jgi:uncharacterized protein with HEPN domain
MLDERQLGLLRDILDSAQLIRGYVAGLPRARFLVEFEKQDAVMRRLEIIGEAASRLTSETQARFPAMPIRSMKGMRNIIAHDYGEVDLELVWKTVSTDLEPLIQMLSQYFANADSHATGGASNT